MSRSNLIFLAACRSAMGASVSPMIAVQGRASVVEDRRQTGRAPACSGFVRRVSGSNLCPIKVLLIHMGFSASKSAMKQMAGELARWGCDCYLSRSSWPWGFS